MNIIKANSEDVKTIAEIARVLYLDIPDFVWTREEFIKKQIERGEYYIGEELPFAKAAYSAEAASSVLRSSNATEDRAAKAGSEGNNGKAAGVISLRERNGMLYIETLAVAKDVRAKGVGSKLVEFARQFAHDRGYKILRTTSFYEYGVKDFWLKQGFKLLDEPGEYGGHKFYRFELEL